MRCHNKTKKKHEKDPKLIFRFSVGVFFLLLKISAQTLNVNTYSEMEEKTQQKIVLYICSREQTAQLFTTTTTKNTIFTHIRCFRWFSRFSTPVGNVVLCAMSTSRCLLLHCYCCWLVGSHIIQKTDYWTHTSNRKIHTLCTICTFFLSHSVSYNQHNNPLADWLTECMYIMDRIASFILFTYIEPNRTEPNRSCCYFPSM